MKRPVIIKLFTVVLISQEHGLELFSFASKDEAKTYMFQLADEYEEDGIKTLELVPHRAEMSLTFPTIVREPPERIHVRRWPDSAVRCAGCVEREGFDEPQLVVPVWRGLWVCPNCNNNLGGYLR